MGCFSKGTCQSPSDTPSLEKYLASSPSSRLSSFADSGKCLLFMYSDLLGQCISKAFYLRQWLANTATLLAFTHDTILCLVGPFQPPSLSLGRIFSRAGAIAWMRSFGLFFYPERSMVPCTPSLRSSCVKELLPYPEERSNISA